jgi:hypothetical protein
VSSDRILEKADEEINPNSTLRCALDKAYEAKNNPVHWGLPVSPSHSVKLTSPTTLGSTEGETGWLQPPWKWEFSWKHGSWDQWRHGVISVSGLSLLDILIHPCQFIPSRLDIANDERQLLDAFSSIIDAHTLIEILSHKDWFKQILLLRCKCIWIPVVRSATGEWNA